MCQWSQHALLSSRFVKGTEDVVCCTKRDVIVGQHTIEERCEKIHHLVISMLRADCAKEFLFVWDQQARWNVWKQSSHQFEELLRLIMLLFSGRDHEKHNGMFTLCCSLSLSMWPNVMSNLLRYQKIYHTLYFKYMLKVMISSLFNSWFDYSIALNMEKYFQTGSQHKLETYFLWNEYTKVFGNTVWWPSSKMYF